MSGEDRGFDHYRYNFTHEELWEQFATSDPDSLAFAGDFYAHKGEGLEALANESKHHTDNLMDFWTGPAADRFAAKVYELKDYLEEQGLDLKLIGRRQFAESRKALEQAWDQVKQEGDYGEFGLNPAYNLTFDEWCEYHHGENFLSKDGFKQSKEKARYEAYKAERFDQFAQVVADLADTYAQSREQFDNLPPPPPPPGLNDDGNLSPQGSGVTASRQPITESTPDQTPHTSEGYGTPDDSVSQSNPLPWDEDDGDEFVAWEPDSYDDLDTGPGAGLASNRAPVPQQGLFGNTITPHAPTGSVGATLPTGTDTPTANTAATQPAGNGSSNSRSGPGGTTRTTGGIPGNQSTPSGRTQPPGGMGRTPTTGGGKTLSPDTSEDKDPRSRRGRPKPFNRLPRDTSATTTAGSTTATHDSDDGSEATDNRRKRRLQLFEDHFDFNVYLNPEEYDD
ncbi:hypothetical protein [Haloglycomyces albus]|uniref:hypothetical protein n=1 Tax=Haloglycomyces albus TaxID=526067 RepID=UPI00046CD78B|nr:hypothetical protein [Haloglycomyces albus]